MPQEDQYPGMTIPEMKEADPEREELTLEVWNPGDESVEIGWNNGTRTVISNRHWEDGKTPDWTRQLEAPVEAIFYGGSMLGGALHGIDVKVDGQWKEVFYETPREQELRRLEYLAHSDRERRERFEQERAKMDERFAVLPKLFQFRVQRRRENNASFRLDWESYEVFCCQQATVFAERALMATGAEEREVPRAEVTSHVNSQSERKAGQEGFGWGWERDADGHLAGATAATKAAEWLIGWAMIHGSETPNVEEVGEDWAGWEPLKQRKKDYDIDTLRELMPEYANGEHSGNTFGVSMQLARLFLWSPTGVIDMHGAGAAISGSDDYGDFPQEPSSDDLVKEEADA